MGDPERYRKQEEVRCWQEENDPIGIFHSYVIGEKLATAKELDAEEKRALADVQAAVDFIVMAVEAGRKDKLREVDFSAKLSAPELWVLP